MPRLSSIRRQVRRSAQARSSREANTEGSPLCSRRSLVWTVLVFGAAAALFILSLRYRRNRGPALRYHSTASGSSGGRSRFPTSVPCENALTYVADKRFSPRHPSNPRIRLGPKWGVRELVIGQEDDEFAANRSYTSYQRDDAAVARLFVELQEAGDSRLTRSIGGSDGTQGTRFANPGAANSFMAVNTGVGKAMSMPGYHALWPLFRLYRLFNIARCPVETPECLSFLDPALGGGKPPDTLVYRKCCVEHRVLRDMTHWTLDVLEAAGVHAALTAGALLGVVRDGGALISTDTDVDLAICPEDRLRAYKALKAAPRSNLIGGVEFSPNGENINVLYAAPPAGTPVPSAAHIEVYFVLKRELWPRRTGPYQRCTFYDRPVWVPRLPFALDEEFPGWTRPNRSPAVTGLYGLLWCHDEASRATSATPQCCRPSDAERSLYDHTTPPAA